MRALELRDTELRRRIVLVALTGVVPLFVVSLLLIRLAYSSPEAVARREREGVRLAREIQGALQALGRHGATPTLGTDDDRGRSRQLAKHALASVAATYGKGREPARSNSSSESKGNAEILELATTLRDAMQYVGDSSNLILDPELDSYYLADMVLALSIAEERLLGAELSAESWWRGGAREKSRQLLLLAELVRGSDLGRLQRDAERSLREDAHFNGLSSTLQAQLPNALEHYAVSVQRLLSVLERAERDEAISSRELTIALGLARSASFALFQTASGELDQLLVQRLEAIGARRTRAYFYIVGTLAAVALTITVLIRRMLAARYREMQAAQDELRAREAQLRVLGNNLPGGMVYQFARKPDGSVRFLYVSAGVESLHGVTAEEVLADARTLRALLLPEDLPALHAAERESIEHKTPFRLIARSRRRSDGAVRWLEFASAPRELPDGTMLWDGIQMDVTDRHRVETAIRQSEQRFSAIFDHSPIAMSLMSGGRFVAVNDCFLTFSGYAREEVIGRTSAELNLYAKATEREVVLQRLQREGRVHAHEITFRTKTGGRRENTLWIEPLTIDAEQYLLVMSLDVTERNIAARHERELEEQLRQAQKLDALGTLAGGIAHDFNNILGAIIAYAELSLLDNPDNPALAENLREVLNASRRATLLVRQILLFSRQQKEELRTQQLAPIVKEALSLLRATLPATISLETALDAPLGSVRVNATQIHQIVINLCTNAAHAMKGKTGTLGITLLAARLDAGTALPHATLPPGEYARLDISDTGHGMDETTMPRIFEPFFTTKPAGEGTGLGLSVVHGIVKEYGGAVTVESAPGRGTTFHIYLPIESMRAPEPAEIKEIASGRGEYVLFVDDEVQLAASAAKMLGHLGYHAEVHRSPAAAIAAFRSDPDRYSILMTDFTMPEMTGVELIRAARAIRPHLPAILVSGSVSSLAQAASKDLGGVEFLKS